LKNLFNLFGYDLVFAHLYNIQVENEKNIRYPSGRVETVKKNYHDQIFILKTFSEIKIKKRFKQ